MRELALEDRAGYDGLIEIDLFGLEPLIAKPQNPDNVVPVRQVAGLRIAEVCTGSPVNSSFDDLALPAAVLADHGGQRVRSGR